MTDEPKNDCDNEECSCPKCRFNEHAREYGQIVMLKAGVEKITGQITDEEGEAFVATCFTQMCTAFQAGADDGVKILTALSKAANQLEEILSRDPEASDKGVDKIMEEAVTN